MRFFERALRRAQIPVSMTKGFNPRPKLSFPMALQLGIEGLNEIMELELDEWIKPTDVQNRLEKQLPNGISIDSSEVIPLNCKSKIKGVVYKVLLEESCMPGDADIDNLLNKKNIIIERFRGKDKKIFDIRPTINSIKKIESGVIIHIKTTDQGMARPKEILTVLGIETNKPSTPVRVIRTDVEME